MNILTTSGSCKTIFIDESASGLIDNVMTSTTEEQLKLTKLKVVILVVRTFTVIKSHAVENYVDDVLGHTGCANKKQSP